MKQWGFVFAVLGIWLVWYVFHTTYVFLDSVGWWWVLLFVVIALGIMYFLKVKATKKKQAIEAESNRLAVLQKEKEEEEETARALERKERRKERIASLLLRYGDHELVKRILHREIWKGQTAEQLLEALQQRPEHIKTVARKTFTREIWCYQEIGKNRYALKITLDDGIVAEFSDDR